MNQNFPNEIEIDFGVSLGISDTGCWVIKFNDKFFPLEEIKDFFRAWLLLERSFVDVKISLDQIASRANSKIQFPFWKLIGSTMKAASGQSTDRALAWVPFLTATEKASLKDLLIETRDSKWASQKSRQLARKYVNEIERIS